MLTGAWLAGLALLVAWWMQAPAPHAWAGLSGVQIVMAVLLALGGALAWWCQRQSVPGLLDWDGHSWCWTTAQGACAARVSVVYDGQRVLLVRLHPEDGSGVQWLWLVPRGSPEHWRAARRALYFRAARKEPPDGTAAMP